MTAFNHFLYNPDDPDLVSKVEADIEEFRFTCPDKHKLLKYTIWCYDLHSDMLKLFPGDLNRRKHEAAIKAGFALNENGRFDKWVEDCMIGMNERYADAVVEFVARFNIANLPAYIMYREMFFADMKAVMSAEANVNDIDKKTASGLRKEAMANAEIARVRMEDIATSMFGGVETDDIRDALYRKAEKMLIQLRPEAVARQIATNTLSLNDPYYPKKGRGGPRRGK